MRDRFRSRSMLALALLGTWLATWLGACSGNGDPRDGGTGDAALDSGGRDARPASCQGPPGLFADGTCDTLAEGVRPYQPRFRLWADGASKERAVYLPAGTRIDTTHPDHWVFPVGTRLYKTFLLDGLRVETRLLEKNSSGTGTRAWSMRAFAWSAGQDAVVEVTDAPRDTLSNVLGTDHDIPSVRSGDCAHCHSSALDAINGFSAVELDHDGEGVTLRALNDEGWLSASVSPAEALVPGGPDDVVALGYLHVNCGSCHRALPDDACAAPPCCPQDDPMARQACSNGLRLWVHTGAQRVEATDTWTSAVGQRNQLFGERSGTVVCRIHPGHPDTSALVYRMSHRADAAQMPPLGTELVDAKGVATVQRWIAGLTPATDDNPCAP